MKKLYTLLLFIVITLSSTYSQNFEGRIVLDGNGFIAVQFRNTTGINLPNTSTLITDFEFDIRWLKAQENGKSADIKMICYDGGYPFEIKQGPTWPQVSTIHQFRNIYISNSFYPPENWVVNEWITVFQLAVILDDNNSWHWLYGSLEIGEEGWGLNNKCIDPIINQQGSSEEIIDVFGNGLLNIEIPTGVELRWVGGATGAGWDYDEYSWNFADNWEVVCPDDSESNQMWEAPRFTDNCIIPDGRPHYPKYPANPGWETAGVCNDLLVEAGAEINWISPLGSSDIYLNVYGDFLIEGESSNPGLLSIDAKSNVEVGIEAGRSNRSEPEGLFVYGEVSLNHKDAELIVNNDLDIYRTNGLTTLGEVTVEGDTEVNSVEGIVIKADETGVGSFINNGNINFTSKSGAKVETFISGTVGDYFMHFAGPTVLDSTNFYNGIGYSGVRLEQFNMTTLDTYTYEWNSLTDTTDHEVYPWVNVYPFWYNVKVANGLAISNWEEGTGTMEMIGKLVTNEVTYTTQSFENNNLELVSNPFSSAIDFEDLYNYGNNSEVIKGHYWVYDASTGNYYGGASGASNGMIQVGQGFFVEVNGEGGNLVFSPSIRTHSNEAFRDAQFNILKMKITGGTGGYSDEMTIRFDEDATAGYDENLEVKKWNSFGMDATMIRSIADDGSELSVNVLPAQSLNNPMTSVPLYFECGYDAEYTFSFSGMSTFEYATSIWIEDLQTGIWNSVSESNPTVTFNGAPGEDKARFLLHFVGPTSLFEADAIQQEKPFHIYTSNDVIYIKNNTDEVIQEVVVFNTIGQEVYRNNVSAKNLEQISFKNKTGFYVVQVRSDQSWVTEKVFINK